MFAKLNGLNKMTAFICIFLMTIFLSSCHSLVADWEYKLPNGYQVVRVNSVSVVFGKVVDESFEQKIDRYITEFCYNESYIGIKHLPMYNIESHSLFEIKDFDLSNVDFYIIDSAKDIQYGPYSSSEYLLQCESLGIVDMCEWINTESIR